MELIKLIQDKNYQVSSILDLGELTNNDAFSLVSHLDSNKYNDINLGSLKTYKASLPLASEIVARSRVDMSLKILYCINSGITIYYMDTDSLIVDRPLPDWMVTNNELGKLKLEHFVKEGVFLAPKVYALKTDDGKEIIKVKGLSLNTIRKDLTFDIMLSLLNKDKSLVFNQIKSFRNFKNTHTLTPNSPSGTRYRPSPHGDQGTSGTRGCGCKGIRVSGCPVGPGGKSTEGKGTGRGSGYKSFLFY